MIAKQIKNEIFNISYLVSDGGEKDTVIHCHTWYEMLYFIRGDVLYLVEGEEYKLSAGSLLLIPPGVLHGVKKCGENTYERYVLSIRGTFESDGQKLVTQVFGRRAFYKNTDGYSIESGFEDIFNANEVGEFSSVIALQALISKIIYMQKHLHESKPQTAASNTIANVINYLNLNFTQDITLDSISARFFISKHHINKLFKRATGTTVFEYVIYKRIYHARGLIQQGMRASEAATRSGFNDYSAFYKAYCKRIGQSPSSASF